MHECKFLRTTCLLAMLAFTTAVQSREAPLPPEVGMAAHGVPGVSDAQLTPEFWLQQLTDPDLPLLSVEEVHAQNARLLELDESMHDLAKVTPTLERAAVAAWISAMSSRPQRALYDEAGAPIAAGTLDQLIASVDLEAIPATQATRHGIVVRRASLRSFPTQLRVFSTAGDTDIDRFQESALFPGTPVLIVHRSADGKWLFVVSPNYAAWIEADAVAEGGADSVRRFANSPRFRVVTAAELDTVDTREEPRVSALQLDMGVRLTLSDAPPDQPVNGQHPYSSWIIELPVRNGDGSLSFASALVPRIRDTSADYLPLTRANLVRQAFKFLGERYGWGHSYNGRDCSGFVSEVFRSMGVSLPRNTSDQAVSPAFDRTHFEPGDNRQKRIVAIAGLDVGDLIYIPGHVMMMVGRINGEPYVIHDTNGGSFLGADGKLRSMHLNAVSITPLEPLHFNATESYIDRMTNIVRMRH